MFYLSKRKEYFYIIGATMKKTKAILCVDDDLLILESLKTQLVQIYGTQFVVEVAESGEEALEVIDFLGSRGIEIKVVISDWLMPKMRGDMLLIKIHEEYPQIATILLTGQADETAVENAFKNANLTANLSKPWRVETLTQVLDKILL